MPGLGAAVAAAIAAITVGDIVAGLISLLSEALSFGLSALTRPKPPTGIGSRRQELQNSVREPAAPRELVIGKVRKGGKFAYIDTVNNERDLILAVVIAGHKVKGIDEIYFFDEIAVNQAGVIQPKFKNLIEFEKHLGDDVQEASPLLLRYAPGWTSEHRLNGVAYIAFKLTFNRDVFSQIPNITAIVRGVEVLDTRDSQTKYSTNPALVTAWYLNHPQYGLNAAYGTEINSDVLNAAANICDEDVAIKAGKTLYFDGSDDEVTIGNVLNLTSSMTVEARINPDATNANQNIIRKDNGTGGYGLQTLSNGGFRFFVRGLSVAQVDAPASTLTAEQWQHIAGVWDSINGTLTAYIDGAQVAQVTGITGTPVTTTTSMAISAPFAAGMRFKGGIQDVRIWNDARTLTEIDAFHDHTLDGDEENLVGYWRLDEKTGLIAQEATETANDGTIVGAAWIDDDAVIGTEKRYACNGVLFSDQLPRNIIEDLISAMAGNLVFSGGEWLIRAGAFETPTVTLDENDCRGPLKIQARRSRRDLFNGVRGTFISPENGYQVADFPPVTNVTFESEDGGERIMQDMELGLTTSAATAQRIAYLQLLRNREQISVFMPCKLSALLLRAGDFVNVTNTRMGWSGKDFEVVNWQFTQYEDESGVPALGIDLELREAAALVYDFNPATDQVPLNPAPNTNLPSPFGQVAIVAGFIEREGFVDIIRRDQAALGWPGTMEGFIRNPLTGHLNPVDRQLASGDDFNVFDNYIWDPVPSAYYEAPESDIDFSDDVRTYIEMEFQKGPGEDGDISFRKLFDVKTMLSPAFEEGAFGSAFQVGDETGQYFGFRLLGKESPATGRFFKFRVEFDFAREMAGFLKSMSVVIDKAIRQEIFPALSVPVGGQTFSFNKPFHNVPSLTYGVQHNASRAVVWQSATTADFKPIVFDNASDTGGTISVIATGV